MGPGPKIETYRELKMPRFEETRRALQQTINEHPVADYDGVFYLSSDTQREYHDHLTKIPSLLRDMDELGLSQYWGFTEIVSTTNRLEIHQDGDPRTSYTLILPVWNTENTFTEFFECNTLPIQSVQKHKDHEVIYNKHSEDSCTLIDRVEIITPTVINVDVPHRVNHAPDNNKVRITVAIRLFGHGDVEKTFERIFNG